MSLRGDIGDYDVRGCVTTRSLGSAGWDSDEIQLVYSSDMPNDVKAVFQEKGRAGRVSDLSSTTVARDDCYYVSFSLDDFLYLFKRIHKKDSDLDLDDFRAVGITHLQHKNQQTNDLMEVLQIFVVPQKCMHVMLETAPANPYSRPRHVPYQPCINKCQYCLDSGTIHKTFVPFRRHGVQTIFSDLFFGGENHLHVATLDKGSTSLMAVLVDYPLVQKILFDSNKKSKPTTAVIKRLLLLLIAARIMELRIVMIRKEGNDDTNEIMEQSVRIVFPLKNGISSLFDDSLWQCLATVLKD